jgi:hypothetical protein
MTPFDAPGSRMESLLATVRGMPIFQQLVPAEAGIGWPIPLRRAGQIYVLLPFFGMEPLATGGATLYRPFATMTLRWPDATPVEYASLRFLEPRPESEWNTPIGHFPHAAIEGISRDQYVGLRRELLGLYDRLLETLGAENAPLTREEERAFQRLFRLLFDPALEPFYRTLGPSALGARFCNRFLTAALD